MKLIIAILSIFPAIILSIIHATGYASGMVFIAFTNGFELGTTASARFVHYLRQRT